MKRASDFREIARDVLRGNWLRAALTALVASLLGVGATTIRTSSNVSVNNSYSTELTEPQIWEFWVQYRGIIIAAAIVLVLWTIAIIVISGSVRLGYADFNLGLVDAGEARMSRLFAHFDRLGAGFCMNFFITLFLGLWSMLFAIPGIIKTYSYAMTPYILAEHPELTARQAITKSRYLMDGNKWRLFCLGFSFIGWDLLCAVPTIIGGAIATTSFAVSGSLSAFLWLMPFVPVTFAAALFLTAYREAAFAEFYRTISGTKNVDVIPE